MTTSKEFSVARLVSEAEFSPLVAAFGLSAFSTADFAGLFARKHPDVWEKVENRYGAGGKGAKVRYSAYSFASRVLDYWSRRGLVDKLEYEDAPLHWGSEVIRYWARDRNRIEEVLFPDELIPGDRLFEEGAATTVQVNRYERDMEARQHCIDHYGLNCSVCDIDFEERYGERGAGFIHVHHRVSLGSRGKSHNVDPVRDLVPVCPNCHAMLHRKRDELTIEALRKLIKR
ncbi:HNH endonuclease [Rhizobium johnstonii]|uniref:HNH endonuclease n=1 Tax=Rhizobium johnstonii TaxID=3019933 RepID=UPI003F9E62CD